MRAAVFLMALLMLTAGCLGFGGDDEPDGTEDDAGDDATGTDGADDGSGTNTTDGTDDHEHEAEPEKHWDNKTGEVQGTNVVVESEGEPAEETTEVPEPALEFSVTLSAEEGEIDGEVYPPGCEEQDEEPGEDCSHNLDTYESDTGTSDADGGNATYSTSDPDAGTWTIRMWKADPGTDSVPYTLEIWYLEEHEPGPGHHQ